MGTYPNRARSELGARAMDQLLLLVSRYLSVFFCFCKVAWQLAAGSEGNGIVNSTTHISCVLFGGGVVARLHLRISDGGLRAKTGAAGQPSGA